MGDANSRFVMEAQKVMRGKGCELQSKCGTIPDLKRPGDDIIDDV